MSKELLTNKNIAKQVKNQSPELYQKIKNIFSKEKGLYHER